MKRKIFGLTVYIFSFFIVNALHSGDVCGFKEVPEKVLIFHASDKENIDSILKEGIKSYALLEKERKVPMRDPRSYPDPFHKEKIYFQYIDPALMTRVDSKTWKYKYDSKRLYVAMSVDPCREYVYNRELRVDSNQFKNYFRSLVHLISYILSLQKADKLRAEKKVLGMVILDQYTAEPRIVPATFEGPLYLNEIVFEREKISPDKLYGGE